MVQPTPRPDRISQDFDKEYPDVEVECRKVLNAPEKDSKKNMENVKLNEEVSLQLVLYHFFN